MSAKSAKYSKHSTFSKCSNPSRCSNPSKSKADNQATDDSASGPHPSDARAAWALAALLAAAGATHLSAPRPFDRIVPRALPGDPRTWTYVSGVAELAVAAAVAHPRTRRTGGLLAAGLFAAVLPANVQMALDWSDRPAPQRAAAYARLPLQIPLIRWALHVRNTAGNTANSQLMISALITMVSQSATARQPQRGGAR
jgi:uncharacterized membrane protein